VIYRTTFLTNSESISVPGKKMHWYLSSIHIVTSIDIIGCLYVKIPLWSYSEVKNDQNFYLVNKDCFYSGQHLRNPFRSLSASANTFSLNESVEVILKTPEKEVECDVIPATPPEATSLDLHAHM